MPLPTALQERQRDVALQRRAEAHGGDEALAAARFLRIRARHNVRTALDGPRVQRFQPDELLPRAMETAFQLAAKSPLALEAAKEAINRALGGDHEDNLAREADRFGELFASEDAKEGLTAFAEKREPKFVGR